MSDDRRSSRDQRGQVAAEYLGILVVVASIIAAISAAGVRSAISDAVKATICKVVHLDLCPSGSPWPAPRPVQGPTPPTTTNGKDWTVERDKYGGELEFAYERLSNHLYDTDVDLPRAKCFRWGCEEAWKYFSSHKNDRDVVARATNIGLTYCIKNAKECRQKDKVFQAGVDMLAAAVYEGFNPGDGPVYVDGTDYATDLVQHPEDAGWGALPMDGKGDTYNGRYYAPAALEKIVLASGENMAELERRALERALSAGIEPGTPQFEAWWKANKPRPAGIPPHVVEAEIAHPGSTKIRVVTNAKGDVVDVRPR